jgi:hypothetical protein
MMRLWPFLACFGLFLDRKVEFWLCFWGLMDRIVRKLGVFGHSFVVLLE